MINEYPEEETYVTAILRSKTPPGMFLTLFCQACQKADSENYELMRPLLRALMAKYPAASEKRPK